LFLLHTGFPFCLVKYSVELNYPEKLTHDKDYQLNIKVRPLVSPLMTI
jgi:hypothetical protein